ncbi:MAG: Rho termination factor N-terminal domain-containing protein [Desulfuromusa sp.]|nr:Rho termination factor N-terminal domain-containing protein [Desulfuromusa sp.]
MNMTQIRTMARELGVKTGKLRKAELIRTIQKAEDNPQCFNTNFSQKCGQEQCLWREDCD